MIISTFFDFDEVNKNKYELFYKNGTYCGYIYVFDTLGWVYVPDTMNVDFTEHFLIHISSLIKRMNNNLFKDHGKNVN